MLGEPTVFRFDAPAAPGEAFLPLPVVPRINRGKFPV